MPCEPSPWIKGRFWIFQLSHSILFEYVEIRLFQPLPGGSTLNPPIGYYRTCNWLQILLSPATTSGRLGNLNQDSPLLIGLKIIHAHHWNPNTIATVPVDLEKVNAIVERRLNFFMGKFAWLSSIRGLVITAGWPQKTANGMFCIKSLNGWKSTIYQSINDPMLPSPFLHPVF